MQVDSADSFLYQAHNVEVLIELTFLMAFWPNFTKFGQKAISQLHVCVKVLE